MAEIPYVLLSSGTHDVVLVAFHVRSHSRGEPVNDVDETRAHCIAIALDSVDELLSTIE